MISEMVSVDVGVRYERGLKYVYSPDNDIITDVTTRAFLFNGGLCFLL
ncbi:MAG: hypothetical protein ACUVRK_03265 [Spirochaetota bacterium]